jgi:hypothetical protein
MCDNDRNTSITRAKKDQEHIGRPPKLCNDRVGCREIKRRRYQRKLRSMEANEEYRLSIFDK